MGNRALRDDLGKKRAKAWRYAFWLSLCVNSKKMCRAVVIWRVFSRGLPTHFFVKVFCLFFLGSFTVHQFYTKVCFLKLEVLCSFFSYFGIENDICISHSDWIKMMHIFIEPNIKMIATVAPLSIFSLVFSNGNFSSKVYLGNQTSHF